MSKLTEEMPGPLGGGNGDGGTPAGWQQRELTDILTPEQLRALGLLLKKHQDPDDALKAMKQYFHTIAPDLEAKGVVPDYLAYVLYAKITGVI